MILVLAGLEMTSNDVHSRMTRSHARPVFRPGMGDTESKALPMESMQFASRTILSNKSQLQSSGLGTTTFDGSDVEANKLRPAL